MVVDFKRSRTTPNCKPYFHHETEQTDKEDSFVLGTGNRHYTHILHSFLVRVSSIFSMKHKKKSGREGLSSGNTWHHWEYLLIQLVFLSSLLVSYCVCELQRLYILWYTNITAVLHSICTGHLCYNYSKKVRIWRSLRLYTVMHWEFLSHPGCLKMSWFLLFFTEWRRKLKI